MKYGGGGHCEVLLRCARLLLRGDRSLDRAGYRRKCCLIGWLSTIISSETKIIVLYFCLSRAKSRIDFIAVLIDTYKSSHSD